MGHGFGLPHSSYNTSLVYDNVWDVMSDDQYNSARRPQIPSMVVSDNTLFPTTKICWDGYSAGEKYTYSMGRPVTITLEKLALPSTTNYKLVRGAKRVTEGEKPV